MSTKEIPQKGDSIAVRKFYRGGSRRIIGTVLSYNKRNIDVEINHNIHITFRMTDGYEKGYNGDRTGWKLDGLLMRKIQEGTI